MPWKPTSNNNNKSSSNNNKTSTKSSSITQVKMKKDIQPKYRTRRWKKQQQEQLLATNMIMEITRVAPTENSFKEHEHTLSIDNI